MTGVLRGIVRDALVGWPDIEVIEADEPAGGSTLDEVRPTTVVCGSLAPAEVHDLLHDHPGLRVLTVEGDGRRGVLHELVPRSVALGELSPEGLLAAVRGAPVALGDGGGRSRREPSDRSG